MVKLLIVGLGGFLGAVLRYLVSGWVQERIDGDFPGGTLVVNLIGCLVLGALMALVTERQALSAETRQFLSIGLLGSLTTFSTFGYETVQLMGDGQLKLALASVGGNVVCGVIAVLLGRAGVLAVWG